MPIKPLKLGIGELYATPQSLQLKYPVKPLDLILFVCPALKFLMGFGIACALLLDLLLP